MIYLAVKKGDEILDAVNVGDLEESAELFKQNVLVNTQDTSTEIWRTGGEIVNITEADFEAFLETRKQTDEVDAGEKSKEIQDKDVKAILLALVEGKRDLAKRLVKKSKTEKPAQEEPGKEEIADKE